MQTDYIISYEFKAQKNAQIIDKKQTHFLHSETEFKKIIIDVLKNYNATLKNFSAYQRNSSGKLKPVLYLSKTGLLPKIFNGIA